MGSIGSSASYPGGGYRTEVSGSAGAGYGGSGGMDMGWIMDLARRRAQQQLQSGGLTNDLLREQLEQARYAGKQSRSPKLESWNSQTGLDNATRKHQMQMMSDERAQSHAQTQAMTRAAPMKMQWGFNVNPGWMQDPNAMSGAQRQMFLPGEAGGLNIATPSDEGRSQYEQARGAGRAGMENLDQLAASQYSPGFGMKPSQGWNGPQSPMGMMQRNDRSRELDEAAARQQKYGARPDAGLWNPNG